MQIGNIQSMEESHRYNRFVRGETVRFLERTNGEGNHQRGTIENRRTDIDQRVVDNDTYIKGGGDNGKIGKMGK